MSFFSLHHVHGGSCTLFDVLGGCIWLKPVYCDRNRRWKNIRSIAAAPVPAFVVSGTLLIEDLQPSLGTEALDYLENPQLPNKTIDFDAEASSAFR